MAPISSLLGWLTILEQENLNDSILPQIKNDIKRLEVISARFSKIGSLPNKKQMNLSLVINNLVSYMQIRMPKDISLEIQQQGVEKEVEINPELMEWVFENLIKNSIDATRGKGVITIELFCNSVATVIIRDTGSGIPKKLQKTIFTPGVTTKKRGWGLGLSLAKRIVEQYHGGNLSLVESSEKGTVFEIQLALTEKPH